MHADKLFSELRFPTVALQQLLWWAVADAMVLCCAADFVCAADVEVAGRRFTLPDEFELELVAASPLVDRPITAAFDEQGRLYVADSSGSNDNVQKQLEERPHRIVRLEDTDGDGHFDKSLVFADRMMFPEGTMWLDGSLYVAAPPSIWKLTDTNDDGVADRREEWFEGKTLTGCANDLHGPYLGPDGWIYWCKGAFAEQTYEQVDGGVWTTRAAHIFRRHPSGGLVEPVMAGGMDNPVDVVFTPTGERIFTTTFLQHPRGGKRDGLIHALYGGLYGKVHGVLEGHPRTGELLSPLVHLGAAAPCGLVRMRSDAFGAQYQDNLFAALFNMQKVTRHVLRQTGATFEASLEDFLVTEDRDFHPTDLVEDADGSLLVIDTGGWYKLCCPTSQLHKPDVLGGIYRISRRDAHLRADVRGQSVRWDSLELAELAKLVADPRPAVRARAQRRLAKAGEPAVPALQEVARRGTPRDRRTVVWTLCQIGGSSARAATRFFLTDDDPTVQQVAVHAVSVHRDATAEPALLRLLGKGNPAVQRAVAEALGRVGGAQAASQLLAATESSELDRALEHSLIYAVIEIDEADPARQVLAHTSPTARRAALVAADQMSSGGLSARDVLGLLRCGDVQLEKTAWWLVSRHPEWAGDLTPFFAQLFNGSASVADLALVRRELPPLLLDQRLRDAAGRALHASDSPAEMRLAIADSVAQSALKAWPSEWWGEATKLLRAPDGRLVEATVAAMHALEESQPDTTSVERLVQLSQQPEWRSATCLRALAVAVRATAKLDLPLEFVCEAVVSDQLPAERALAVEILLKASLDEDDLQLLITKVPHIGPMELSQLLALFRRSAQEQVGFSLIAALQECPAASALATNELVECLQEFPESTGRRREAFMAWLEEARQEKRMQMERVIDLLADADIRRGQAVFNSSKASCRACHEMGYLGGNVGPDLTRIGRIRSERDLLEAILYPSLSFVRSYEPVEIVTVSGRVFTGLVRDETNDEVVLAIDAQKQVRVRHDEIELRRPGKVSVMPKGLEKQLTQQELADLVKFLHAAR